MKGAKGHCCTGLEKIISGCAGPYRPTGRCPLCAGNVHLHIICEMPVFQCVSCGQSWAIVGTFPDLGLLALRPFFAKDIEP